MNKTMNQYDSRVPNGSVTGSSESKLLYIFFTFIERVHCLVYNNILTLSVYLCIYVTGYRLGPWRAYKHETGFIRTRMIWKEDTGGKICWKATGGGIKEEKIYATNAFIWEKFYHYLFLCLKRNYLEGSHTIFEKIDFLRKGYATYTFLWEKFSFEWGSAIKRLWKYYIFPFFERANSLVINNILIFISYIFKILISMP